MSHIEKMKNFIESNFSEKIEIKRNFLEEILLAPESKQIFMKTERILLGKDPEVFFSFGMKNFSIELLQWVLKSIS